jgi:CrcB protein
MSAWEVLAIALAGGLGAAARFTADAAVRSRAGDSFPWGTAVVNVSGSMIIGLATGAALFHDWLGGENGAALAMIAVGFCGGFTTFSTAMAESVRLVQSGAALAALLNAFGTVVTCTAAAAAGVGVMYLV